MYQIIGIFINRKSLTACCDDVLSLPNGTSTLSMPVVILCCTSQECLSKWLCVQKQLAVPFLPMKQ